MSTSPFNRARDCVEQLEDYDRICSSGDQEAIAEHAAHVNEMAYLHCEPVLRDIMRVLTHDACIHILESITDPVLHRDFAALVAGDLEVAS